MLRRAEKVWLEFRYGFFRPKHGSVDLHVGNDVYRIGSFTEAEFIELKEAQKDWPFQVGGKIGERRYWFFQDRYYWENDDLDDDEVYALLVTRQQRERGRIERAQALVGMDMQPQEQSRRRDVIPDDVKQMVWLRDGGRCRQCGAQAELQFDHIIPFSMGGSSNPENLQILCGPCNRGVVSVFAALAVPVAHLATLVMVYLAANYLTVVFDSQRGDELGLVFDAFPQIESLRMLLDANWYIAAWSAVEPFLELNWFTGGYTLLAIILLTISYFIREDSEVKTVGYILAWPGIIWCVVVVIALFIFLFKLVDYVRAMLFEPFFQPTGNMGEFLKGAFFILESGVEWLIYIGACRAAVGAPRLIFRLWKKPRVDAEAVSEAS